MRGARSVAAVIATAQVYGCGADPVDETATTGSPHGNEPAPSGKEQSAPAVLPTPAPRWVAVVTHDDSEVPVSSLEVVRFDDATAPETIQLADGTNAFVSDNWVWWSPSGLHVTFATCDFATLTPSVWVVSAADGFVPRLVALGLDASEERCANALDGITLSWMGSDTLFAVVETSEEWLHYRIGVASLEPELLGRVDAEPLVTTSPFGVLYALGEPGGTRDLWFVAETGEPRRMSSVPEAQLRTSHGALTWAPDGQSATWWTQWPPDEYGQRERPAPDLEVVPGQLPKIGHVHVETGVLVDSHPKGDLRTSYEYQGMATSPQGSAIAYGIYRRALASFDGDTRLVLVRDDSRTELSGGVVSPIRALHGFLDEERLFYSARDPGEPDDDTSFAMVVRQGSEVRELGTGRWAPFHFDAFRRSNRLFFARPDVDRQTTLWSVDLDDPAAYSEVIPLDGFVVGDSLLKQGQIQPPMYVRPVEAELGEALLLATSDDKECWELHRDCQIARWIVNFEPTTEVTRLADHWTHAVVSWAPDGSGLVAVAQDGLSYIPGPAYDGAVRLQPDAVAMVLPTRWPATL